MFRSVMLLVAFLSGLLTLALIPVVLRVSKTRPPALIIQVALVAGCLPAAVLAIQYFTRV